MSFVGEQPRSSAWWTQWVHRPEQLWLRQWLFQLHFWVGVALGGWVLLMSLSGSLLVFRDPLSQLLPMNWVLDLHKSLLGGPTGLVINAFGGFSLLLLTLTGAVIWWPGRRHWRRSLTIQWRARFPRISWDAHSALGFWFLPLVGMWGVSGFYLASPQSFDVFYRLDPADRVVDRLLFALTALHFGRFNPLTQIIWTFVGLIPAVLAFTGIFICCRRVIFKKPSNPLTASD